MSSTRRTPQRLAVEAYLKGNKDHPCAEDIHGALLPRFPAMSLSTVYNILHRLQREGTVHELAFEHGKARFDQELAPHSHLVCIECRKVVDLERDFDLALSPSEAQGYRVLHGHVGFFGICPECQQKGQAPPGQTSNK